MEQVIESGAQVVRAWVIGPDGTEIYVAHSEEEMRQYYVEMVGAEEAAEHLAECFKEIPQEEMDIEWSFRDENDDPECLTITTYRKLALDGDIPGQIISGYN